jgi:hypothetical protein
MPNSFDAQALSLHDTQVQEADPLTLDLEDEEFIEVVNQRIADSRAYYEGKRLPQRQEKNLAYYLGQQFDADKIPTYETPYIENVVYEAVQRIRPIASSRLPDLTVKPGSLDAQSIQSAKTLTDVFNTDINRRENRKLLGLAHVHEQLFFFAALKARWNTELGTEGNYEFLNVHPQNIVWDHTCKTNSADDMLFVAESCELTVKEVLMMFPKKKEAFLEYLAIAAEDRKSEKRLASKYKIWEVWFHWYKESTDEFGNTKWEKIQAVMWKYGTFVLGKMRNPYFDYEGKMHLFSKEMQEKGLPTPDDLFATLFGEQQSHIDTIYYNYFKQPRKPYFFMVYESLGQDPIDATNRIEQILYFQDHINKEGMQIISMNERSAGKPIFNSDALDKKTIERIDWHNFKQAISVNGDDINKLFTHVEMPPAPSQLYQSKSENRSIAFEMLGVNATTRGVQESGDETLGQSQMFREQDFGFIDNLVEETINEAAEWMAQWSMQFIRVFYTKQHFVDTVGKDGEALYVTLTQDMVEDGMSVEVSASGVDKMMRKRMAIQNMQMGVGDLLSYYEDTEQSNPKERARRAFIMKASPQIYYQEFLAPEGQGVAGPIQPPPAPAAPPSDPSGMPPAPQAPMGDMAMAPAAQAPMG